MLIYLLTSNKPYSYTNSMLIVRLIVVYAFVCMPFSMNANSGGTKGGKKIKMIAPTPSIGPDDSATIGPNTPAIEPTPPDVSQRSYRKITPSIDKKPTPNKKQSSIKSISTKSQSIGPSKNTIGPSPKITPRVKTSPKSIGSPPKSKQNWAVKKAGFNTSNQLLNTSYTRKTQSHKTSKAINKPASILEMFDQKKINPKEDIKEILADNQKPTSSNINTYTSINWLSWEEAMEKHAKEPRKIVVDLYTDWCTWCVKMEKTTFQDPAIIQYINDNFYAVKFNAETRKEVSFKGQNFGFIKDGNKGYNLFSLYLTRGRLTFPSIIFLDETINNPQPIKGFQNASAMERLLQYFGEDFYKKMDWSMFNRSTESAAK